MGLTALGIKGAPRLLGDCDLETPLTSFKHSLVSLIFFVCRVSTTRKYLKLAEKGKKRDHMTVYHRCLVLRVLKRALTHYFTIYPNKKYIPLPKTYFPMLSLCQRLLLNVLFLNYPSLCPLLLQTMAAREDVEQTTTFLFSVFAMVGTNRESLKETLVENSAGERRTGTERLLQLQAGILCSAAERRESSPQLWLKRESPLSLYMRQGKDFCASLEDTKGWVRRGHKGSLPQ